MNKYTFVFYFTNIRDPVFQSIVINFGGHFLSVKYTNTYQIIVPLFYYLNKNPFIFYKVIAYITYKLVLLFFASLMRHELFVPSSSSIPEVLEIK